MDYIGPFGAQQLGELTSRIAIPNSLLYEYKPLDPTIGIDFPVTPVKDHDMVSAALEQLTFLLEYDAFTTLLLVMTMNENYLHSSPFPACPVCPEGVRNNSQFGTYMTPFRPPT